MSNEPEASEEPAPKTMALVRPLVSAAALIKAQEETAQLVTAALKSGTDYGVIPGTGTKPTLLKPGAERMCKAFGCDARYEIVGREVDHDRPVVWTKRKKVWRNAHHGDRRFDWREESGTSSGLYRYEVRCQVVHAESGRIVGEGIGVCSTMEGKYVDRPRECENTALKMAQKRALVAATLNAFALSDRFTQDLEDQERQPAGVTEDGEIVATETDVARVTLDSEVPFGKHRGQKVRDVPHGYFRSVVGKAAEDVQDAPWFLFAKAALDLPREAPVTATAATSLDKMPPALEGEDEEDDDLPF